MKKIISIIICFAMSFTIPLSAQATEIWKPAGPVRIIVGYAPGGGADYSARIITDKMSEYLKVPVIIENKPGAAAGLAMAFVKKSPADGLTLGLGSPAPLGTNLVFNKDAGYDPIKDFDSVGTILAAPRVLITNSTIPVTGFQNLVSFLKKNPNTVTWGGISNGVDQLVFSVIKKQTDTNMVYVGYKGGALALNDFLGEHINMMFDIMPTLLPHIQSGKANLVAVAWPTRLKEYPNVPTLAELGYSDINDTQWFNLIVPKGTPKNIIESLNSALKYALADPGVREKISKGGSYPIGESPSDAQKRVEKTYNSMMKIKKEFDLGN